MSDNQGTSSFLLKDKGLERLDEKKDEKQDEEKKKLDGSIAPSENKVGIAPLARKPEGSPVIITRQLSFLCLRISK